jgi:hypothetical protein
MNTEHQSLERARNAAARVASKTAHEVIARYIEFAASREGYNPDAGLRLAARVRAATANKIVGGCIIEIPRTEFKLVLSPVPASTDHTLDLMVPPMGDEEFHNENVGKLRGEIFQQVAIVRQMVIAYWVDFRKNKTKLWRDIDNYLGYRLDIVASPTNGAVLILEVNAAPEKLLDAPNCAIGVDHYYIDKNDRVFSTRLTKK